jgi:hypothetical protein
MPYQSPFKIPDEYMRLVGIIASHWESLDIILQRSVAEVMSMDMNDVRLLTENISVSAKLDLLTAHAREALSKDEFNEFNKMIRLVQAAYGQRNAFVHAKWDVKGAPDDLPWRFSVRTKGGRISIVQKPTELTELEEAADAIYRAGEALTTTLQKHGLLQS